MKYLPILLLVLSISHLGFAAVENCKTLKTGDNTKCAVCNDGYSAPAGEVTPNFTKCILDNCKTMDTTAKTKCDTCNTGFSGPSGETKPFTKCNLDNCGTMDST